MGFTSTSADALCFLHFVVCMQIHDVLYLKKLQLILISMACLKSVK